MTRSKTCPLFWGARCPRSWSKVGSRHVQCRARCGCRIFELRPWWSRILRLNLDVLLVIYYWMLTFDLQVVYNCSSPQKHVDWRTIDGTWCNAAFEHEWSQGNVFPNATAAVKTNCQTIFWKRPCSRIMIFVCDWEMRHAKKSIRNSTDGLELAPPSKWRAKGVKAKRATKTDERLRLL